MSFLTVKDFLSGSQIMNETVLITILENDICLQ